MVEDGVAWLLPGAGSQLGLRFVPDPAETVRQNAMHLHLTSTSSANQQRTVTTALELGARHLDIGQRPEERHVVLADPEGNEFCVIEPGNAFLAGCGFLGELSCCGTRDVGLFWSAVTGWPLVWDRDQQTAVQSPDGGTKVSWGGEPPGADQDPDRQRLELATAGPDHPAEIDRLITLGAVVHHTDPDGTAVLTDPDGTEFRLLRR